MTQEPKVVWKDENSKLEVLDLGVTGPRGAMLRLRVPTDIVDGSSLEGKFEVVDVDLLEGNARRLGLKIRQWVRRNKELRGENPRGRRKHAERQEARDAAAAR